MQRFGQSSFEAISLFAAASIILSIFMIYFGSQISTQAEEREYDSLRDVADLLRYEIQIARIAGPGYVRTLEIPATSGGKPIIFTLAYSDDPNISSELTVTFEPPIRDAIEASQILGPGVYGLFSAGTNTIRVYEGGIVVEPDKVELDKLADSGLFDPDLYPSEMAFAYIEGPEVRLSDEIECEYALSNEWNAKLSGTKWVDVGFIASDGVSSECRETGPGETLSYGTRVNLSNMPDIDTSPGLFRKGNNLSCIVRYIESASGSPPVTKVCPHTVGGPTSNDRIARSLNVTIVNSLPGIEIRYPVNADLRSSEGDRSIWEVTVIVDVSDADPDDNLFNVSIVPDGTNAAYIDCGPNDSGCVKNSVSSTTTFSFVYNAPWPATDTAGCTSVDDLTFRIKAIEEDSTSELYTLEDVDVSDELNCY